MKTAAGPPLSSRRAEQPVYNQGPFGTSRASRSISQNGPSCPKPGLCGSHSTLFYELRDGISMRSAEVCFSTSGIWLEDWLREWPSSWLDLWFLLIS